MSDNTVPKNHIIIRLSVSDDVGYATNMLEHSASHDGLLIMDPHSDMFPAKDDKVRWFIEEPVPSQPWRKIVTDTEEQTAMLERLRTADSVTILAGISGNKSRLRETTLTYLLESLTHPEIIGLAPDKIRIAFQRMPHDREDKPHIRPDGRPVHNLETFRLFSERLSRYSAFLFTPPLHSHEAEASLARAYSEERGKNYRVFDVVDTLVAPVAERREVDIDSEDLVILSPDGANKVKVIDTPGGKRLSIPSAVEFAATVRNGLYPDKPYDLQADMQAQFGEFNRAATSDGPLKFNDPLFDALPKIRRGDDKVEIPIVTEEIKAKVRGKRVLLVDDTTDTAGTFLTVAEKLLEAGARDVDVAVVYPNFSSYKRPLVSKTMEAGDGAKVVFTNAMKRALTERNADGHLLISDIYTLRTIRNILRRQAAILGTNVADNQRFHVASVANFMLEAVLHSIDMAENRELRPHEEMPRYEEETMSETTSRTTRTRTMDNGGVYVTGPKANSEIRYIAPQETELRTAPEI